MIKISCMHFLKIYIKTNRANFKILDDFINDRYEELRADHTSRKYNVVNVHGHVGEAILASERVGKWSYRNLDSDLGKTEHPQHTNHQYLVYISKESDYAPKLRSTQQENAVPVRGSTALMDVTLNIPISTIQTNLTVKSENISSPQGKDTSLSNEKSKTSAQPSTLTNLSSQQDVKQQSSGSAKVSPPQDENTFSTSQKKR